MKYVSIGLVSLLLAGCTLGEDGLEAKFRCTERDRDTNVCVKGEYMCFPPTTLRASASKKPRCYYD